jgi:hypothetical protein
MADDVVRLHVEVITEEAANVKETYNILEKLEKKMYSMKGQRKKFFENPELFDFGSPIKAGEDRGPIFRGQEEGEEVATTQRPGKKGQAIQRQDIFKNLTNRVEQVETQQDTILAQLQTLSPFLLFSGGGAPAALMNVIKPLVPFIGEALIAIGFVQKVFEMLFMPGGVFDRRFKLILNNSMKKFMDRRQLASIRQRFTQVRITSWISPKGYNRGQFGSNLLNPNNPIYDAKHEMLAKDL